MLKILIKPIKIIIMSGILALVTGFSVYYLQPNYWQARALVGLGVLGDQNIESPYVIAERFKSKSFLFEVVQQASNDKVKALFFDKKKHHHKFKIKSLGNEGTVVITFDADDADTAKNLLEAAVIVLQHKHEQLVKQELIHFETRRNQIETEISSIRKQLFENIALANKASKNYDFQLKNVVFIWMLEIYKNKQSLIEMKLLDFVQRKTALLEEMEVEEKKLFPSFTYAFFVFFIVFSSWLLWQSSRTK